MANEGLTYGDQPWNRTSVLDAFDPTIFEYMRDRLVWNCGTIAGEQALFRSLALNLYLGCAAQNVTYSDQASLNVLLTREPYREMTQFNFGDLGWACQAATMAASARGPQLSYKYQALEPLFDGQTVYTSGGRPFCIVDQYDRVQRWEAGIEKKFN